MVISQCQIGTSSYIFLAPTADTSERTTPQTRTTPCDLSQGDGVFLIVAQFLNHCKVLLKIEIAVAVAIVRHEEGRQPAVNRAELSKWISFPSLEEQKCVAKRGGETISKEGKTEVRFEQVTKP